MSGEAVGWGKHTRCGSLVVGAVCGECARGGLEDGIQWHPPRPCLGCGRPVSDSTGQYRVHQPAREGRPALSFLTGTYRAPRLRALCSPACAETYYRRRRAAVLAQAREKTCTVCGARFTPTRADAATCSSACRQRVYRRRLREKLRLNLRFQAR